MSNFGKLSSNNSNVISTFRRLEQTLKTHTHFFMSGEFGCGRKTLIKEYHQLSSLKNNPIYGINISSYPNASLDAPFAKLLDQIAKTSGTFIIENIDDLPHYLQNQLSKAISESKQAGKLEQQIFGLCQRNLDELVKENKISTDLVYALGIFRLSLPPLSQRKEDITNIANQIIFEFSGIKGNLLSPEVENRFLSYKWPGNITELRNEIESALIRSENKKIQNEHLSPHIAEALPQKSQGSRLPGTLRDRLEQVEQELIFEALEAHGWNKSKVSKILGISRAGLIMKVEKYGLDKKIAA